MPHGTLMMVRHRILVYLQDCQVRVRYPTHYRGHILETFLRHFSKYLQIVSLCQMI